MPGTKEANTVTKTELLQMQKDIAGLGKVTIQNIQDRRPYKDIADFEKKLKGTNGKVLKELVKRFHVDPRPRSRSRSPRGGPPSRDEYVPRPRSMGSIIWKEPGKEIPKGHLVVVDGKWNDLSEATGNFWVVAQDEFMKHTLSDVHQTKYWKQFVALTEKRDVKWKNLKSSKHENVTLTCEKVQDFQRTTNGKEYTLFAVTGTMSERKLLDIMEDNGFVIPKAKQTRPILQTKLYVTVPGYPDLQATLLEKDRSAYFSWLNLVKI